MEISMSNVRKILLLVILSLTCSCSMVSNHTKWEKISYQNIGKYSSEQEKVIIYLYRDDCEYCKEYKDTLYSAFDATDYYTYSLETSTLSKQQKKEMNKKYGVEFVPTILLFKKGKYERKLVGNNSKKEIKKFISGKI